MEDDSVRKSALMNIASSVVEKHVDLAADFVTNHMRVMMAMTL